MVVQLNDSDDSDSDMDACTAAPSVFGGLEFMIKEARRTVEVGGLLALTCNYYDNKYLLCKCMVTTYN